MSVKASSEYQVVIPKGVCQSLGLKPEIVPVKSVDDVGKHLREALDADDTASMREKKDPKV